MRWLKPLLKTSAAVVMIVLIINLFSGFLIQQALNSGKFQAWLSQETQDALHYESVEVTWEGASAYLLFHEVALSESHQPYLRIPTLRVRLDVLSSFRQHQVVFSDIYINALEVKVSADDSESAEPVELTLHKLWPWIYPQRKIDIKNATVKVIKDDLTYLTFSHMRIKWRKKGLSKYHFSAQFSQPELKIPQADIVLNMFGQAESAFPDRLKGHIRLNQASWKYPLEGEPRWHIRGGVKLGVAYQEGTWRTELDMPGLEMHKVPGFARSLPSMALKWRAEHEVKEEGRIDTDIRVFEFKNSWLNAAYTGQILFNTKVAASPTMDGRIFVNLTHPEEVLEVYLDNQWVEANLRSWLVNNIFRIDTAEGQGTWFGPLTSFPYEHGDGEISLDVRTENVDLRPERGWPEIDDASPRITWTNTRLNVSADKVRSQGLSIDHLSVDIPDLMTDQTVLNIALKTIAPGDQVQQYLASTPVEEGLPWLPWFDVKGNVQGKVDVRLPLYKAPIKLKGEVTFENNTVMTSFLPPISEVSGTLAFTDDGLLPAGELRGEWSQAPIVFQTLPSDGRQYYRIEGSVGAAGSVSHYLNIRSDEWIKGRMPFTLSLREYANDQWTLKGEVETADVSLNLPKPYDTFVLGTPIHLVSDSIFSDQPNIELSSDIDSLWAELHFKDEHWWGDVALGVDQLKHESQDGIHLWGSLPYLDAELIRWAHERLPHDNPSESNLVTHLHVEQFALAHELYGNLDAVIMRKQGLNIGITGNRVSGHIIIPKDDPIKVHFRDLDVKWPKQSDEKSTTSLKTTDIPEMDINIDRFSLHHEPLGELSAFLRQANHSVVLEDGKLSGNEIDVIFTGDWFETPEKSLMGLSAQIKARDWATRLKSLGMAKPFLDAQSGQMDMVLTWPGAPHQLTLEELQGQLRFHFVNGAVMNANSSVTRFLGLMNIASINRRLLTELDDVHGEDLIYDEFSGAYTIENGVLETHDAHLQGPVLDLTFIGKVDLAKQRLDKKIRAVPHFGNSMAMVAGVIGGPVAAALTWMTDKVLGSTVFKNGAVLYHLKGDWEHYTIEQRPSN